MFVLFTISCVCHVSLNVRVSPLFSKPRPREKLGAQWERNLDIPRVVNFPNSRAGRVFRCAEISRGKLGARNARNLQETKLFRKLHLNHK